ncbi:MAG: segregation/condensation protein A, partial [Microcystis sp. M49629_WE12]|nr:segregation/condensation protein A [Microcystis sp. M49629_WE12]
SATQEKVAIFWALLLLASQSKVELKQEDFYQDLTIALIRVG